MDNETTEVQENTEATNNGQSPVLRFGQRQLLKRQAGGQKQPVDRPVRESLAPEGGEVRGKSKRVKYSDRNRISFSNLDPEYVYRVVNDKDGRIAKMQSIGYEFVESDEQIGDYRAAEGSKMGKAVSKPVGNGTIGYLMRTKREYYDEDQAEKSKRVDAIEASLKPRKEKEEYGTGLTSE
jgi:hypothetical protein